MIDQPICKRRSPCFRWATPALFSMIILSASPTVHASDGRAPDAEKPQDKAAEPLREQTVYIPYEKLREVFEREGRGVFLPYEQFQELWRAAREATKRPADEAPPVDSLITETHSDATIERDVVRVRADVRIEVLTEGWHEIPLRLADAAITSATIGDKPARVVERGDQGYGLLFEQVGKDPAELELHLEYSKAFTKSPGQNRVSFQAPRAPVSKWRVHIPEAGVKVNIEPLIAASQVPDSDTGGETPAGTTVLAFVGAAPSVRIDWTPRAEGAMGLKPLVDVQADQRVWIHEGVIRSHTHLAYDISRAAVDHLLIDVPDNHKVVNVSDANIRQWSLTQSDAAQQIAVELFEPELGRQNVRIELERFITEGEEEGLVVPVVAAVGVGRQQGSVAVALAEGLRAEAIRRTGLLQVDTSALAEMGNELPGVDDWALSYRYVALPFDLVLRVEKILPRITVDSLVEARLQPELLTLYLQAVYNIEKAGVFDLQIDLPQGFRARSATGSAIVGATPVEVSGSKHPVDDPTKLTVNLERKALGRVGLLVEMRRTLDDPDLLRPSGKAAEVQIAAPQARGDAIERSTGRLIVYAPPNLRVAPAGTKGLRVIPVVEALEGMESVYNSRRPKPGPADTALAFAYADGPASVTLKVERRRPHIVARQLLAAHVESGVVTYRSTFFYDVRYSSVDTLRIDVPEEIAGRIQNQTSRVHETVIDPAPPDLAPGYVALEFRGESEFIGPETITLSWETQFDPLEIGRSARITVPRLMPMGVARSWGQIVLAKGETIDVHPTGLAESQPPAGLRPIDPRHDLMEGVSPEQLESLARAFEFHDDWQLGITATRYKLEEVKRTSIERSVVKAVVTRSNQLSVQALYRMRSARQRLPVSLPSGVEFDTDPLRLNGRSVPLESGKENEFFIPLVGQQPDKPFLLEIRYTVPGGGTHVTLPIFPTDPAAQKTYICAYLPREWAFLGFRGPWTDELRWRLDDAWPWGFKPYSQSDDQGLVQWVSEGVGVTDAFGQPSKTFQADGKLYLFSTLRAPPPPGGMLRLTTINHNLLRAIVFVVVVAGGLLLLRTGAPPRLLAGGILLTALILLGVFLPTFALQILDVILILAVLVVVIIWTVRHLGWTLPNDPDYIARKQTRQEARLARIRAPLFKRATAGAPSPPVVQPPSPGPSTESDEPGQDEGGRRDA